MKRKIILIDDDKMSREDFSLIFNETEFQLDLAANSRDGLEKIRESSYEAVLLDLIMPDLNNEQSKTAGFELLQLLQEEQPFLPIIMVTVVNETKSAVKAIKLGATDYITKDTFDSQELIAIVRQAIDGIIYKEENEKTEFKSTLRWNQKAKMFDKNIELECMRAISAFLNSEGGTLFVGIDDNGSVIGVKQDGFVKRDHFQLHFGNLIKKHIGIKYANLIKYSFRKTKGKDFFRVDCKKSKEPVYLKIGEEEQFYVRIGASSRKLNMSETVSYVKRMN